VLGGKALVIALGSVAGSIICVRWIGNIPALRFPVAPPDRPAESERSGRRPPGNVKADNAPSPLWNTARIIVFFASGVLGARMGLLPRQLCGGDFALYAIWILVLAVGVSLGGELRAFRIVRQIHVKILVVPAAIVAGTFLGAAAVSRLFPDMLLRDALAVGAGFGYYSLSSLLIEQFGNSPLAAIALLANILRELMGLLGAPFLARVLGPLAPVAAAGATSMDTCLPVIARHTGPLYAIIAVFSGMVLTLLVPLFVTAAMRW
jgi:uncharacterized membrane protein YbjE (DUF340 family)